MKVVIISLLLILPRLAQESQHDHAHMPGMDMGKSTPPPEDHFASGTSINPRSSPMYMIHKRVGDWTLMFHGVVFIMDVQQTSPLGGDKFFSPNWFMGAAERDAGGGSIEFRAMLSLDPATITNRSYPLLFQTGETAYSVPLVNAQHPHDFSWSPAQSTRIP